MSPIRFLCEFFPRTTVNERGEVEVKPARPLALLLLAPLMGVLLVDRAVRQRRRTKRGVEVSTVVTFETPWTRADRKE